MQHIRDSLKYIQEKFPINHDVISNSVRVDVTQRCEVSWENIQFFLDKYSALNLLKVLIMTKCMKSS